MSVLCNDRWNALRMFALDKLQFLSLPSKEASEMFHEIGRMYKRTSSTTQRACNDSLGS